MQDDLKNCPKISIITVSYNSAKTIEQTILSVINQSYKNIEYIIIDGGSTDGTVDIIKKYADKIAYWVSESDEGIYHAMNKGIDIASGDYIYFLGSDDWLASDFVLVFMVDILILEKVDVLVGNVFTVDEKYNIQYKSNVKFDEHDLNAAYRIPHQGCFIDSKVIKQYKFDLSYKIAADYNLFLKLYFDKTKVFKYVDYAVAFYSNDGYSSKEDNFIALCNEDYSIMLAAGIQEIYAIKRKKLPKSIGYILKKNMKRIIYCLGIYRYIQVKRGWANHNCNWGFCRVCKNKN